jgi:hypothetical protein
VTSAAFPDKSNFISFIVSSFDYNEQYNCSDVGNKGPESKNLKIYITNG